jgi:hypothetical protein
MVTATTSPYVGQKQLLDDVANLFDQTFDRHFKRLSQRAARA